MDEPLVTVVCLCYNQGKFVRKSVESVIAQNYSRVQLILVDDASTDGSAEVIEAIASENPEIECLLLERNVGSCRAFNRGLDLAKGEFIIDLAADDLLMSDRIARGVDQLTAMGKEYAIQFSDANYIDEQGRLLWRHSEKFPHDTIPQGDIYREIIYRYFICPTTMMMRTSIVKDLGGYDESLHYEDFDLLIRCSRDYKLCYSSEVLVSKRVLLNSLSSMQKVLLSPHSISTYRICRKILALNRTESEKEALSKRIRYEIWNNLRLLNLILVVRFLFLLRENRATSY